MALLEDFLKKVGDYFDSKHEVLILITDPSVGWMEHYGTVGATVFLQKFSFLPSLFIKHCKDWVRKQDGRVDSVDIQRFLEFEQMLSHRSATKPPVTESVKDQSKLDVKRTPDNDMIKPERDVVVSTGANSTTSVDGSPEEVLSDGPSIALPVQSLDIQKSVASRNQDVLDHVQKTSKSQDGQTQWANVGKCENTCSSEFFSADSQTRVSQVFTSDIKKSAVCYNQKVMHDIEETNKSQSRATGNKMSGSHGNMMLPFDKKPTIPQMDRSDIRRSVASGSHFIIPHSQMTGRSRSIETIGTSSTSKATVPFAKQLVGKILVPLDNRNSVLSVQNTGNCKIHSSNGRKTEIIAITPVYDTQRPLNTQRFTQNVMAESGRNREVKNNPKSQTSSNLVATTQFVPGTKFPEAKLVQVIPLTVEKVHKTCEVVEQVVHQDHSNTESTSNQNLGSLCERQIDKGGLPGTFMSMNPIEIEDVVSVVNKPEISKYNSVYKSNGHSLQTVLMTKQASDENKQQLSGISKHVKTDGSCCLFCPKKFDSKKEVKEHVSLKHAKEFTIVCQECKRTFRNRKVLNRHKEFHKRAAGKLDTGSNKLKVRDLRTFKVSFSDIFPLRVIKNVKQLNTYPQGCCVCGRNFSSALLLSKHLADHSRITGYTCYVCGLPYKSYICLAVHYKNKHQKQRKPLKCIHCGKRFSSKKIAKKHRNLFHTVTEFIKLNCTICDLSFSSFELMQAHMEIDTRNRAFKCKVCDMQFHTDLQLTDHMSHVVNRLYGCRTCHAHFSSQAEVKRHRDFDRCYALPYGKMQCDLCAMDCVGKSNLKKHKKVEHGMNAPVVCKECGKCLSNDKSLQLHKKNAHKRDWIPCKKCEKLFKNTTVLVIHEREEHSKFPCRKCNKKFKKATVLENHIRNHHSSRFQCTRCFALFSNRTDFRNHMKTRHDYVCEECKNEFTQKRHLLRHIKFVHEKQIARNELEMERLDVPTESDVRIECDACGQVLDAENSLAEHAKLHLFSERLTDDDCGMHFLASSHHCTKDQF